MKICAAMLGSAIVCLAAVYAQAGEFVVINESESEVVVTTIFWRPAGTADSIAFDAWPNAWIHEGWWTVKPGGRATVYSGNQPRVFVRIAKNGAALAPQKFYKQTNGPVMSERFRVEEIVGKELFWSLKHGVKLEQFKSGKNPRDLGMNYVEGFYEMDSATNFTVK